VSVILAFALFAQALVQPQRAYTTADPVRPDAIGLATMDGRYAISRGDNCDGIGPDMNVQLWRVAGFSGIGVIAGLDALDNTCNVRFEQRMSDVPWFTNDDGDCDVDAEAN